MLLPESTNAILAIDVASLLDSQFAQANHWREARETQSEQQLTMLPPHTQQFVLATELGFDHFEPLWEFAAMKLERPVEIEKLREDADGRIDSLAGLRTVRTERGSFIIPFSNERLGLIRIAPRAWAAQQTRHGLTRSGPTLAPFLNDAIAHADAHSQIVIAIHLEDVLPPETIRNAIARSTLLANSEIGLDALTETFANLQGFMLTVDVTDRMHGRLQMLFDESPSSLAKFGKTLMLDLLTSAGSSLPEFSQWEASQIENSIAIEGELSIEGLRKLLSLVHYDVSDMLQPAAGLANKTGGRAGRATADYAKHVTRFVDTLKTSAYNNNLNTQILWTDRAAKSIMRLSTKDVRPEVADLGTQIAYELSEIVSVYHNAAKTASIESNAKAKPAIQWQSQLIPYEHYKTPYGIFYRYAPISYANVNIGENLQRTAEIQSSELAKANQRASDKFYDIEKRVSELVRQANLP